MSELTDDGFSEVNPGIRYIAPQECDGITGVLLEVYPSKFKKPVYKLRLSNDEVIGVNSCGSMEKPMEKVNIGDTVRFKYDGKRTLDRGQYEGKEFHVVTVFVKRAVENKL